MALPRLRNLSRRATVIVALLGATTLAGAVAVMTSDKLDL